MNLKEYLLTCLIEECAEVTQRCSKILRFGSDEKRPGQEFDNTELLMGEINDFLGVLQLLEEENIIPNGYSLRKRIEKKEKVKKYMNHSRTRGTLND